jgi:hypothetical protein
MALFLLKKPYFRLYYNHIPEITEYAEMREGNMKGLAVILLIFSMIVLPVISISAYDPPDICAQAKKDAVNDTSQFIWLGAGCLLSFIGVLLGYAITPAPPAERLTGKDSNYMMLYISCYRDAGKSVQSVNAIIGCVAETIGSVIVIWMMTSNY